MPTALAFRVRASQESDDLASNSGGGCGAHQTSASLDGYSELFSNSSLGGLPCDTQMYISGNGRTVLAGKVDSGTGSSFGPAIGLYPRVSIALFGTRAGGSFEVTIWRADGKPLTISAGVPATPTSPGSGAVISSGGTAGLGGSGLGAAGTIAGIATAPATFTVGQSDNPDEDYWTGMNRMAQATNRYLFSDGETVYFIDGADLIAQDVAENARIDISSAADRSRIKDLSFSYDNTAYQGTSNRKKRTKATRGTRLVSVVSPTEIKISLFCGVDEFRAGDVMILSGVGAANGRWVMADVSRSVFATFSDITLTPPIAPLPDSNAAGTTGQTATAAQVASVGTHATPATGAAHRGTGPYAAIADSNLQFAGVDQGIDFTGGPGHVYALADGVITRRVDSGSGWPGSPGSLLVYRMTSGSHAGRYVYTAEDFDPDPSLQVNARVTRGQSIGVANGKGVAPGIETGWADPDGQASARAPSSGPTSFGRDFDAYVRGGGG